MIVYVNGDSHSAGAEAVNGCAFANDDPLYWALGRLPHPDNERASYGCEIANYLGAILHCDAESASSNDRILRTTQDYLKDNKPELLIIGWSTWEREEWLHEGTYWQVNAGGVGNDWPAEIKERYKPWVIDQCEPNVMNIKLITWHNKIHRLHQQLDDLKIPHIFFNTFQSFSHLEHLKHLGARQFDWNNSYVDPYSEESTYYNWLLKNGFKTVKPTSYHFGADAHRAWGEHLYQNYVKNVLTS